MQPKIRVIRKKIKRKQYIAVSLYVMFVLLSLFVMSSYTWFSLSKTPRVNNMNVYITSASGLELSRTPNAETWYQELNFVEIASGFLLNNQVLRPVTWSDRDGCFYRATYGFDGRHAGFDQELNDGDVEYFIKTTYYARTGQTVDVKLKQVVSLNLDPNMSLSSMTDIDLAGTFMMGLPGFSKNEIMESITSGKPRNAEKAVRIGFRITPVNENGNALSNRGPMIIYEPNCDVHAEGTITGYVPTPSIDGTTTLVDSERLILQNATTFGLDMEADEAQILPGEFESNPTLFKMNVGEIVRIEMYIWLEGQDVDCTNAMAFALDLKEGVLDTGDQWLIGNIQFDASTEGQSGLVPIE